MRYITIRKKLHVCYYESKYFFLIFALCQSLSTLSVRPVKDYQDTFRSATDSFIPIVVQLVDKHRQAVRILATSL